MDKPSPSPMPRSWLGHGTLWVVFLHSILYYIYWGVNHSFWVDFKEW